VTLYVFPDAQLAALAILRADPHASGVQFGTLPLSPDMEPAPTIPYVAVRLERSVSSLKALQTASLRVSVWHESEAQALALAQVLRAVLLAASGDAAVRSFGELTGPSPAPDPDSGLPLASFTVAARLRPVPL
jgi:hypothetical protein